MNDDRLQVSISLIWSWVGFCVYFRRNRMEGASGDEEGRRDDEG